MIDINKKYRTRDGREVRIYATDHGGRFTVCGAVLREDGSWSTTSWKEDGAWMPNTSSTTDLIEVREKKKVGIGWVNFYPTHNSHAHSSKEGADRSAGPARIACKYIEIEYEEGEGL